MVSEVKRDLWWLGSAAAIFFISSLVLAGAGNIFNSPDETANAFFATTFGEHGRLYTFEPLNVELNDALHPRSMVSIDGRIIPGSFLGLPVLYGVIVRLFSPAALPFLTPLVAILAAFAWYAIVRRLFDRLTARIAALLVLAHPAVWYYAARGMHHNVLFLSLIVFAAFFLIVRPFDSLRQARAKFLPAHLDLSFSGIMIGLALFVRTSEIFWIFAVAALIIVLFWKRMRWQQVALFVCSVLLALSPMFFLNRSLYGHPLATGYTVHDDVEPVVFDATEAPELSAEAVASYALPFGIHPRTALRHVAWYGLGLFWWMTAFTLIGIPLAFPTRAEKGNLRRQRIAYLLAFAGIGAWLAAVYGSWNIHDNPDPTAVTIANSYIRYWLPVFLMTTPFAALAIGWLCRRPFTEAAQRMAFVCVFVLVFALSVRAAFYAPEDGVVPLFRTLQGYAQVRERVLSLTEEDAVLIVDRADKLFFPYRRVLYPLRAENDVTYDLMPRIALRAPLYYYGVTFPETDIAYLNGKKLLERGLQIELVETFEEESLYRIYQQ